MLARTAAVTSVGEIGEVAEALLMFARAADTSAFPTAVHVDRDGRQRPYMLLRTFPPPAADAAAARVVERDRLDLVAYRYFGDPEQFWRICDANSDAAPGRRSRRGRRLGIPVVVR